MGTYKDIFVGESPKVTLVNPAVRPLIDVLGVPFDGTSSYRPGSRFGPNSIRDAFMNIELFSERLNVDLESLSIQDLGNLNRTGEVASLIRSVSLIVQGIISEGRVPAILGGEHLLSYAAIDSLPPGTAVIIFDAHLDMRMEFENLRLSHATWLRRLIEEKSPAKVCHIGSRAATPSEWEFAQRSGIKMLRARDLTVRGLSIAEILGDIDAAYVSIDLDVLDPAFAPGVANPEPAGLSSLQLLNMMESLRGTRILAFDIVELCPPYDNGCTALMAARLLCELSCLAYLGSSSAIASKP